MESAEACTNSDDGVPVSMIVSACGIRNHKQPERKGRLERAKPHESPVDNSGGKCQSAVEVVDSTQTDQCRFGANP